jgi:hypothetical protein
VDYWLFFGATADTAFNIGVGAVYLAVYLGVPAVFLRIERGRRTDLASFLEKGLHTSSGHVAGKTAIMQILMLPFALAIAIAGMGVICRLSAT